MPTSPVATNDSCAFEFVNDGGAYRAELQVRPKARPDGTLVVNTQSVLSVRTTTAGEEQWSEVTVGGAVCEFAPNDEVCGGGVGLGLVDRSAHVEMSWSGERVGGAEVRLTEVTARLSKRFVELP